MKKLKILLVATATLAATLAFTACGPMTDICLHTTTTDVATVAATCETAGTKAYTLCTECYAKLSDGEEVEDEDLVLAALGHNLQAGEDSANYFDANNHFAKSVACANEGCTYTEEYDAIQIGTKELFKTFVEDVNALVGHNRIGCDTVEFTADIDMTGETFESLNHLFGDSITFVGNGHKITGLSAPLYRSLPAVNATFSDLTLDEVSFDTSETDLTNGGYGAFVGMLDNNGGATVTFENCKVTNSSIKAYKYAGGFVGFAAAANGIVEFENCELNNTNVTAVDSSCGGLLGHTYAQVEIKDCKVLGTSAIGCEEDREGGDAKAGYFVGTINGGVVTIENAEVAETATLGNMNAKEPFAGGLVGRNYSKLMFGEHQYFADGVYINEGVYEIHNAEGMFWFAQEVNDNHNLFIGKTVRLIEDIDLKNEEWTPIGQTANLFGIGQFYGTFDGNGKTIKNLKISERHPEADTPVDPAAEHYATGLFGWTYTATIKNITIDGANIEGSHFVGTIAGYNEAGTISGCIVKNIVIKAGHYNGDISCGDKIGGIVGYNYGTIDSCHVINANITAGRDAGWIAGAHAQGCVLKDCTVTGTKNATKLEDCTGANWFANSDGFIGRLV